MINTEIEELRKFIIRECQVKSTFGMRDLAPDEYPHVQIIPNQNFTVFAFAGQGQSGSFPVQLKIIVDRKQEREAIAILEKLFCKLGQFTRCKGHEAGDAGQPQYTDNTYEITLPFNLRYLTQGI